MISRAIALGLVAAMAMACAGPASNAPTAASIGLTVFAAASLRNVAEEAAEAFEGANAGTTVAVSTDSSAALRTQIEQGAPADVFLAADLTNPQRLVDAGLTVGAGVPFAMNRLALIVPKDNPANLRTPFDLAGEGVRVIGAGDEVPITAYADRLIAQLAGAPGAPAGFAEAYAANLVSREDNVRAVLTKIELGEGDAAIVYATDALASDEVATIDIPDGLNVDAIYGGVIVRAAAEPTAAQAFLDWLRGPIGRGILVEHGFAIPPA